MACALAAPVLGLWGAVIGIGMGMSVADSLLGVMPGVYAGKLVEMVTPFDLFSLAVKSVCFGGLAGLAACYEGLRCQEVRVQGCRGRCFGRRVRRWWGSWC